MRYNFTLSADGRLLFLKQALALARLYASKRLEPLLSSKLVQGQQFHHNLHLLYKSALVMWRTDCFNTHTVSGLLARRCQIALTRHLGREVSQLGEMHTL